VCPAHCQSEFLFQSFDTPGDEVAPWSDEIAEDFQNLSCFHNYFYDLRVHNTLCWKSRHIISPMFCHPGLDPGSSTSFCLQTCFAATALDSRCCGNDKI